MRRTGMSLEDFRQVVADVRGPHIIVPEQAFYKVHDGVRVNASCELHQRSFRCLAASLVDDGFAHPCVDCKITLMLERKIDQTEDDFQRIIGEIKLHYKDKPYSYEHSEASYFKPPKGNDARTIRVYCKRHDYPFTKTRIGHLKTTGCPKCARESVLGKHLMVYRSHKELVAAISKANVLNFDLSRIELTTIRGSKQWVRCKHGWKQTWTVTLLRGGGCQRCSAEYMWQQRRNGAYTKQCERKTI